MARDLINHGWTYINTDFGWNTGEIVDPVTLALQPDPKKYPDYPGMCQTIHSLGLKVGLYSSPWTRGYSGESASRRWTPNGRSSIPIPDMSARSCSRSKTWPSG